MLQKNCMLHIKREHPNLNPVELARTQRQKDHWRNQFIDKVPPLTIIWKGTTLNQ